MKINMTPEVFARLEAIRVAVGGLEFSGFGFIHTHKETDETVFEIYDVVLLDVGSSAFTEIPAEKILPLLDRADAANMKVWFHRHPCGSDVPGEHNWSGTDERTATTTPLGGVPEMVKWAISIVRTPKTWIGRVDMFKEGTVKTAHLSVHFCQDQAIVAEAVQLRVLYEEKQAEEDRLEEELADLHYPFVPIRKKGISGAAARLYRRLRNTLRYRVYRGLRRRP